MVKVNGVDVYEPGEAMQFPPGTPDIPIEDHGALFGYRLEDSDGVKKWVHASEEDYRGVEQRLGRSQQQIDESIEVRRGDSKLNCRFTGHNQCGGDCGVYAGACRGIYAGGQPPNIAFCSCSGVGKE